MVGRNLFHLFILLGGMLTCGVVAVYFGKELNWDLANYHYYNAYHFLEQRWNIDYWPASFVHVHFTPTLDFLTYFLINQLAAKHTVFIMGALHGINFWLLFCIARYVLPPSAYHINTGIALALAAIGLYGPTVLPGMGSFQHDNLVSIFVLTFILLQLHMLSTYANKQTLSQTKWFVSSMILGMGVGAKLTAGIFVGGAVLAFLLLTMPWRLRIRLLMVFGLGVAVGMLVTSGYWMLFLWQKYHNPFFPLWNGLFHSPDFPFYNWHDTRFMPQGWLQTVFYPFYFSMDGRTSDTSFRDFRFAILYVLFLLAGLVWLVKKIKNKSSTMANTVSFTLPVYWLFLFFLASYLLWQSYFSIMRYIAVLEMLAPILIYLLLRYVIRDGVVCFSVTMAVFLYLVGMMMPTSMVRAPWYQTSYFNVSMPAFVKQTQSATVLVAFPAYAFHTNPRPQAYLIPFFPASWRFIGIPFLRNEYTLPNVLPELVKHTDSLYLLASPEYMKTLFHIANRLGYGKREACHTIPSDRQWMTHEAVWLCAVKK